MTGFFERIFGTPTIESPTLGILNLSGESAHEQISADRTTLGPLFRSTVESAGPSPSCSVLLIYCSLDETGSIVGSQLGIRELIRDAGAKVAVVATPNSGESYIAATKNKHYGRANLVMTIDRKGGAFAVFFSRLFSEMKGGVSMPVAWVKLAPQVPGMNHADVPDAIFACEVGQLKFG